MTHNGTFISERKPLEHLFSFTRTAQAVLFKVGHGPINGCTPVVMGHCRFSPSSSLKRKAYLPALVMSPLLTSPPSRQWQDKSLLPGEPFWKAQPFLLDSVVIMTDTQRTTSHKGSQWPGARCLYVRARVSLALITSWNTLWSCPRKKEHWCIVGRSIKVICLRRTHQELGLIGMFNRVSIYSTFSGESNEDRGQTTAVASRFHPRQSHPDLCDPPPPTETTRWQGGSITSPRWTVPWEGNYFDELFSQKLKAKPPIL